MTTATETKISKIKDGEDDLPFSIIGKVVGIASDIYSSIQTENYRSKVLESFSEIEAKLDAIENLIKRIASEQKMTQLMIVTGNAEADINTWYYGDTSGDSVQNWLKNNKPCPSSLQPVIASKGKQHLEHIHQAILGTLENGLEDWVSIYLELLPGDWDGNTSMLETSYSYFIYLVRLQLHCFAAMAWANVPGDGKTEVPGNIKQQGKFVSNLFINCIEGKNPNINGYQFVQCYSSKSSDRKYAVPGAQIYIGGTTGLPKAGTEAKPIAIYDFGINEDSEGAFMLHALYGELGQDGYVSPIGKAYCEGGNKAYDLNTANNGTINYNDGHQFVNYLINAESSPPPRPSGYVMVDICFQLVDIKNVGNSKNTLFGLVLQCTLAATKKNSNGKWYIDYTDTKVVQHEGAESPNSSFHFFTLSDYFDAAQHNYGTNTPIPPMTGASFLIDGDCLRSSAIQDLRYISLGSKSE